ncbi:uncharacterized protein JCM6883_006294 [Sporobolomyces salmoneus]|uniref:uncharacterized protein n=1 Tax=Sporobolomyces salmoneus TaxID=183962 RepID=UPI0031717671
MPRRVVNPDSDEELEDAPSQQRQQQRGGGASKGQQDLASLKLADPLKTCRHLFLQSLISRRVMRKELAEQLYKDCVKLCKVEDAPDLADFMASIEKGINLIGFDLRQSKDQETGQNVYILANSVQDTAAKLATEYKAEEIAFFKAIVAKIMLARDMSYCVSQSEAVKEAKAPITRVFAIQLVKSFLAKDWLSLHPSGRLILSTRSLTELAPYIRETFTEEDEEETLEPRERTVVYCAYCTKIVTSGYACPNRHCPVRLHTDCASATIGNTGQCPDRLTNNENPCTATWKKDSTTGKFVGHSVGVSALGLDDDDDDEAAAPTSDVEEMTPVAKGKKKSAGKRKPATKGKGKGKGKNRQDDDDEEEEDELMDDDDDEDEDEDDEGGSAAGSSARRSSARVSTTKRRTIQAPDSDDDDDE